MRVHRLFFALLLVFLPTQLGFHFWPDWAMILGRRVDYLSPTLYLTDILLLLTATTFIISNFPASPAGRQFQISNKFSKFFFTFLLVAALNIFFAVNKPVAIYHWIKVIEFVMLGWYIVRTRPSSSSVLTSLSIGIVYSSILAITQFILQHSVGGPLWWLGERTFSFDTPGIARFNFNFSLFTFHFSLFGLRPYATFPHPNVLGGFLAAALPLVFMGLMSPMGQMGQMKKRMYVIVFAAGLIALLLTFSRSAIVVGTGAMLWALLNIKYQISNIKFMLVLFIVVIGALLITHRSSLITLNEESVVVRQQLNSAAISMWQQSPVFGVGMGNFLVRLPDALPTRTIYFLQPNHNIYLLVLSEVGLVGVGLIVLWIALQSQKRRVYSGKKKTPYPLLLTSHFSLLTLLVLGLVDHYPLTLQQGQLLFTLLVALTMVN